VPEAGASRPSSTRQAPEKSLSAIAREVTGTKWNGLLFFACVTGNGARMKNGSVTRTPAATAELPSDKVIRCAIYIRKSTEEGLQQDFGSLDAQREAGEAFIASQRNEGWQLVSERFGGGGFTGCNMDRPVPKATAHRH
jgi:hypothetical protein